MADSASGCFAMLCYVHVHMHTCMYGGLDWTGLTQKRVLEGQDHEAESLVMLNVTL